MKWNVSVGLRLSIDYDDIEADTREEAEEIAKDRAVEDVDFNNADFDESDITVYTAWPGKGAGMGDYYCSLCCETVSGDRERECPNCGALMYTDEEYAMKLAEWEAEDEAERAFWSLEGIV